MVPISKTVQHIVDRSTFLREGLVEGVINLTGLARKIQPEVEKSLLKPASIASIVMSLQRYTQVLATAAAAKQLQTSFNADISIRSNLTLFIVEYSQHFITAHKKIGSQLEKQRSVFLSISYGINEISWAINTEYKDLVKEVLADFTILNTLTKLSAITIRFTTDTVHTPGVYYRILQALAWNNINFVEIMSSGNELTIFFEFSVVDQAFSCIQRLTNDQ